MNDMNDMNDMKDKRNEDQKALVPAVIDEQNIQGLIYDIRGQKVMLDVDLAGIYGYETRAFNQQVKRNMEKFDGDDFMFRLDEKESENLRSQFVTSSWGGTRYLPYAFTEQGIYMLMTVLKGELAVKQSKALIRTFKKMKDYIIENQGLLGQREYLRLSMQTTENIRDIMELRNSLSEVEEKVAGVVDKLGDVVTHSELSEVMIDFGNPAVRRGFLILNGQPVEADLAYAEIYGQDEKSIYVIDNYIGLKTLALLKNARPKVEIIIFTDNLGKGLHKTEYDDFAKEYPNLGITLKTSGGIFHDRYIILDDGTKSEKIYHCGASSKDAGNRVTTITEVPEREAYRALIEGLLKNAPLKWGQ